ncbi:MAG: triose-phosphate isomerase [Phycisphaerae bacterium]|nr:triose-phosphate isomerase [Phycisphaerae bacterium]
MDRRLFVAGNWKMNLSAAQCTALASELATGVRSDCPVEVAVCPPSVYLSVVHTALDGSAIRLGAQNVYCESNGAFTGQISPAMLLDIGCDYVIIGHSETRHTIEPHEDDALINRKLLASLAAGLKVILCIGETLDQRKRAQTESVLDAQLTGGLANLPAGSAEKITIAYEPVWAIGTGQTATTDQAQQAHAFVRTRLAELFDSAAADRIRIQYGGSVKPSNAAELLAQPDVDGALVGGASLKADDFLEIIKAGLQNPSQTSGTDV